MSKEHPNVSLLQRLDLGNLAGCADLFAEDFVWHFFNRNLPDVQGDYVGLEGLQAFFDKLGAATGGTFAVEPVSITPFGDELVVTCVRDTMAFGGTSLEIDAVRRLAHRWRPPRGSLGHPSSQHRAPADTLTQEPRNGLVMKFCWRFASVSSNPTWDASRMLLGSDVTNHHAP